MFAFFIAFPSESTTLPERVTDGIVSSKHSVLVLLLSAFTVCSLGTAKLSVNLSEINVTVYLYTSPSATLPRVFPVLRYVPSSEYHVTVHSSVTSVSLSSLTIADMLHTGLVSENVISRKSSSNLMLSIVPKTEPVSETISALYVKASLRP